MKRKILILGIVVAMVAALVVPLAVAADGATTTGVVITGGVTQTATPTINTPTQIYVGATEIKGTSVASANITLTVSGTGGATYTTTADGSGNWDVTSITALIISNGISVIAQKDPNTNSAAATATVATPFASITAPTSFSWSPAFGVGGNTGSAATPGLITSGNDSYSLTVSDANSGTNTGYMISSGTPLTDLIQFYIATISSSTPADTISNYQSNLQGSSGYNAYQGQGNETFSIPLYAYQYVEKTDVTGTYSITLNYTLTPSI